VQRRATIHPIPFSVNFITAWPCVLIDSWLYLSIVSELQFSFLEEQRYMVFNIEDFWPLSAYDKAWHRSRLEDVGKEKHSESRYMVSTQGSFSQVEPKELTNCDFDVLHEIICFEDVL
jgi:hypothetical protein